MNGDKKKLIIRGNKIMPDDFWNYLVNPILGYYNGRLNDPRYTQK